jgi:hypothetical protein
MEMSFKVVSSSEFLLKFLFYLRIVILSYHSFSNLIKDFELKKILIRYLCLVFYL